MVSVKTYQDPSVVRKKPANPTSKDLFTRPADKSTDCCWEFKLTLPCKSISICHVFVFYLNIITCKVCIFYKRYL